jgi:cystathionine beta-synthase
MPTKTLLDAIGNTPIIRLMLDSPATIYAKLEYLNPGGSVKDRSALYMIEQAEKTGLLKPGGTLIDASSGNQGISTAMIGAVKGYKVIITVSAKVSLEKLRSIQAYGAEIVMCPSTEFVEDPRGYQSVACKIHAETPNSFMLNQYFNLLNAEGHYYSLGPEIWRQTEGKITHFFAATGTGGTISGTGKYLKEKNKNVQVIGVDAAHSYRATGGHPKPYKMEGIGVDFVSPVLDYSVVDAFAEVSDVDGLGMLKVLARKHGLLVGPSAGAVAHAVAEWAKKLTADDIVVFICGDSGRAYLSKELY